MTPEQIEAMRAKPLIPIAGQAFTSHQQWVNKASSWLTCHPEYRNTEHGEKKGWRGSHFTTMCFDQKGRRVRCGGDFRVADEEGAFPIWWIWPDQVAPMASEVLRLTAENERLRAALSALLQINDGVPMFGIEANARIENARAALKGDTP